MKLALHTTAAALLVIICILALGVNGGLAGEQRCGIASWYGEAHHGKRMANQQPFDMNAMTAAMWDVPLGSRWLVTRGSKLVVVTITDRGPKRSLGRLIDLSKAAASKLGMIDAGIARVCVTRV